MEINPPPQKQLPPLPISSNNIELLNLKLNQQLEVKILNSSRETKTLELLSDLTNKPVTVESNLAIKSRSGQVLQLIVIKTTPSAEFKIIAAQPDIQIADSFKPVKNQPILNNLLLKQIKSATISSKTSVNTEPAINLLSHVISAKVLSVTNDHLQIKLYTSPTDGTAAYTKNLEQNLLKQHNPIVTLNKKQIITTVSPTNQNSNKHQTIATQSFRPGQKIQLELNKDGLNPEFKIVNNPKSIFHQDQLISAKVIDIKNEMVKLAIFNDEVPKTSNKTPARTESGLKPDQIISVSTRQIHSPIEKSAVSLFTQVPEEKIETTFKPGQNLILEVKKTGSQPEFNIIEANTPKLKIGQLIPAVVNQVKNNQVHLLLQLPSNSINSSNTGSDIKPEYQSIAITLNQKQLVQTIADSKSLANAKDIPLDLKSLYQGQNIKLEVVKNGIQTEFKLVETKLNPQTKILETLKQVLPIQESPTELINQIAKNLTAINNNEKISDTLKRIAREILQSLPQVKDIKNPAELKKTIQKSGLFLESKFNISSEKNNLEIETDFKNQLLKFRHAIKQELELKNTEKSQTNEINLIKEFQQKTENSLAKIILNQLMSLPKDDTARQVWIIDLPILNKDVSESVKIEIDQEQKNGQAENQSNWSVTITISPPEMGTIHCKISCFDKTVSTRFWSNNQDSVMKITDNLDYLKSQFVAAGITPGQFTAHAEKIGSENPQKIINQSLFDQEA